MCKDLKVCPAGTRVKMTKNSEAMAKFAVYTKDHECVPCDEGTYTDTDNAPECTDHTCAAGSIVTEPNNAKGASACDACPEGTFVLGTSGTKCVARECGPGEFVDNEPEDNIEETLCEACGANTYKVGTSGATACKDHGCHAGEFIENVIENEDNEDKDLPKDAASVCTACASGDGRFTFKPASEPLATACVDHTCDPGTRLTNRDNVTADASICGDCEEGTFTAAKGLTTCEAHTCPAGEYVAEPNSADMASPCAECPDGEYKADENGATGCTAWTECPKSQPEVKDSATKKSDRACECDKDSVEAGYFLIKGTKTCQAHAAECAEGAEYEAEAPTASRDRVCEPLAEECDVGAEYESTSPDSTTDRVCTLLTVCGGETPEVIQAHSATSDRQCGQPGESPTTAATTPAATTPGVGVGVGGAGGGAGGGTTPAAGSGNTVGGGGDTPDATTTAATDASSSGGGGADDGMVIIIVIVVIVLVGIVVAVVVFIKKRGSNDRGGDMKMTDVNGFGGGAGSGAQPVSTHAHPRGALRTTYGFGELAPP